MPFFLDPKPVEERVRNYVRRGLKIAVIIPCFRVQSEIATVVNNIPDFVWRIFLVNDASTDETGKILDRLEHDNPKVSVIHLPRNTGVGGAVLAGCNEACRLNAHILVKLDGDGQMDPAYIPLFVEPLFLGKADYAKGNRLLDSKTLNTMPFTRRWGNACLSFLNKLSSGYWNVLDPTNGFLAVRKELYEALPQDQLSLGYFFESSILIALGIMGGVVVDIPHPPRYGNEVSNLKIWKVVFEFPVKLLRGFLRRIWLRKMLITLTMEAVLGVIGLVLMLGGTIFGLIEFVNWAIVKRRAAPSGTVMSAALPFFLGFQMLMNAILLDIQATQTQPLCRPMELKADECINNP